MKPVLVGIAFFVVYGLFSIKSQAAEVVLAGHDVFVRGECR